MKRAVCRIFGAGEYFETPPLISPDDFVVAADGGADYLFGHNIKIDLFVGDFDSCSVSSNAENTVSLPQEKNQTDMAVAIDICLNNGFRRFYIYGGTGGRFEHTYANMQLVADLAQKGARGFLFDKQCIITAIRNESVFFDADATGFVSVFAHSDTAKGVCERGLKYKLNNATLTNTFPLGVSNMFISESSCISVENGTLILIYGNHIKETDFSNVY